MRRDRQAAAERGAALAQELHLRRVLGRLVVLGRADLLVGQRQLEPVAEREQRVLGHLLGLVGDHLALARDAHAVALDRLGQDHGRLAGVRDGLVVGGVHLLLVQPAAVQQPDLVVGHVRDALEQHRVAPKKCSRTYAPSRDLNVWYSPSTHSSITFDEAPVGVGGEQRIPARPQIDLDHVPAGAAEVGLELLDDLAVAADRAVEPLQVAVDDPDQVVEPLAAGERGRAHRLGLVHLAVAEERPHLASRGLGDPARLRGTS